MHRLELSHGRRRLPAGGVLPKRLRASGRVIRRLRSGGALQKVRTVQDERTQHQARPHNSHLLPATATPLHGGCALIRAVRVRQPSILLLRQRHVSPRALRHSPTAGGDGWAGRRLPIQRQIRVSGLDTAPALFQRMGCIRASGAGGEVRCQERHRRRDVRAQRRQERLHASAQHRHRQRRQHGRQRGQHHGPGHGGGHGGRGGELQVLEEDEGGGGGERRARSGPRYGGSRRGKALGIPSQALAAPVLHHCRGGNRGEQGGCERGPGPGWKQELEQGSAAQLQPGPHAQRRTASDAASSLGVVRSGRLLGQRACFLARRGHSELLKGACLRLNQGRTRRRCAKARLLG
mmetsp:Transcript_19726/g.37577  ORF Transcript_19726/g.37577 Transcript_19726/m.37577 type:complete len:349 (+) Transcript_19726:1228-2274(+)